MLFQERLSHGIAATGFPGNPHRSPTEFTGHHPYFPPHFPTPSQAASAAAAQHQAAQEVFAAQNPHLAATDPYNVNSLHSFQTSQVQQVLQTISSVLLSEASRTILRISLGPTGFSSWGTKMSIHLLTTSKLKYPQLIVRIFVSVPGEYACRLRLRQTRPLQPVTHRHPTPPERLSGRSRPNRKPHTGTQRKLNQSSFILIFNIIFL